MWNVCGESLLWKETPQGSHIITETVEFSQMPEILQMEVAKLPQCYKEIYKHSKKWIVHKGSWHEIKWIELSKRNKKKKNFSFLVY